MNLSSCLQIWMDPKLKTLKTEDATLLFSTMSLFFQVTTQKMQFQNNPWWKTSNPLEKTAALNLFSLLLCILRRGSCRRSSRNLDVDNRPETTDGWYHLERMGLWSQTTSTSSCVTAEQQLLQLGKKAWSSSRQIPPRTLCLGRLTEKQQKMSHLS